MELCEEEKMQTKTEEREGKTTIYRHQKLHMMYKRSKALFLGNSNVKCFCMPFLTVTHLLDSADRNGLA
jgi:hypothetical protein